MDYIFATVTVYIMLTYQQTILQVYSASMKTSTLYNVYAYKTKAQNWQNFIGHPI
jgi:hypothetical protein